MKTINLSFFFGVLISITSYGQVCDSIVAAYNFNGNAVDITGHGYNLTVHGATLSTDRFGNPFSAYQVNWNQYLEIATSNLPQLYQNFSYSIWYRPDAIHGGYGPIWIYGNNPDSCDAHFALIQTFNMMGSSRIIDVWAGCMDSIVMENIGGGTPDWTQITVVNDGTQIKTYINGGFIFSPSVSFPMLTQSIFTIGSNPGSHTIGCYGLVDDLYIYNCALSDSEILTLYLNSNYSELPQIKSHFDTNSLNLSCSQEWINSSITIYDISGQTISSNLLNSTDFQISFLNLAEGYYILSITGKKKVYNTKFLVIHN